MKIPYGTYCLHCYADLPRSHEASVHCEACGKQNLRVDRERRWTLEPAFVKAESAIQIAAWIAGGLVILWSMIGNFGFGLGHIVGVPVVVGLFHATASRLTHRMRGIRFDIIWLFAAPATVFVALGFTLLYWGGEPPLWLAFGFLAVPVSSPLAWFAARWIERAKARRVHARNARRADATLA